MDNKIKEHVRLQEISNCYDDYNIISIRHKSLKQFKRLFDLESSNNRLSDPSYRNYIMKTTFYQKIKNIK